MTPANRIPNLKRLREAQGLDREDVAARVAAHTSRGGETVNVRTIRRWENGESIIPDKYWADLTAIFGVSLGYLLAWDDDGENGNGGIKAVA